MSERCDACCARPLVLLTLIPSMRQLDLCGHHARSITQALEAMGGEFETFELTAVGARV